MTAPLHPGPSGEDAARPTGAPLPAQLSPYADPSQVRGLFPVVLPPQVSPPTGSELAGRVAVPLVDLLPELHAATGRGALLGDNLVRLESWLRAQARDAGGPLDARTALRVAAESMLASLGLASEPAAQLQAQLEAVRASVPEGSRLLPYLPSAALSLLLHVAQPQRARAREAWRSEVRQVRNGLADLLAVEQAKDPAGAGAAGAVGDFGASFLDPSALAQVVGPARGGRRMPAERRARLAGLLETLDQALAAPDGPVMVLLGGDFDAPGVKSLRSSDPCTDAAARFDAHATELARAVGALRAARLELAGAYDPAVHDARVAALDWRRFTTGELHLLPVVVAVEDAEHVVLNDMVSLTRLLGSGRPVQVLVDVQATRNPGTGNGPLGGYRVELGHLGMALRQVFVQQSSPARPAHLVTGFQRVVQGTRAGLHLLCSGWLPDGTAPVPGAWLAASSAIESRAHPLFRFDPDIGESWADCLDASDNPEPEADWVAAEAAPDDDGGAPAVYTFADHALLDPALGGHFRPPTAAEADSLLPLAAWLELDAEQSDAHQPVVRAAVDGALQALVVGGELAFACRDRLRSWRSLRELAGYANAHARRAAQQARAEAEARAAAEREALVAAHQAELDRVRASEASEAIGRLAAALVDADWSGGALPAAAPARKAAVAPAGPAPAPVEQAPVAAPAPPPEPVQEEVAEEPWIDTVLCTSCNDCINLNGRLFVYNGNKQAEIGDPTAGTFDELVRAAEACPARCIHPGAPLNPNEPGLDELIARAARFN